jgi:hypothetical protein
LVQGKWAIERSIWTLRPRKKYSDLKECLPMHWLFCWIAANAQTLSAIAAIVTALVTAAYLFFRIRIFREARKSADAAAEAARAATASTALSAELYRPYMGLKSASLEMVFPKESCLCR